MHKIEVPYIDQSVKYPTGCESVSAVMLLKYLGYEMTVDEFIKNCLECRNMEMRDGKLYGPDPNEYFCGSPYDEDSFGIYAKGLLKALEKAAGKDFQFTDESGTPIQELWKNILIRDAGSVLGMHQYAKGNPGTGMETPGFGGIFLLVSNEHCMLLVGYDEKKYYFNDPYDNNGVIGYERDLVEKRHAAQHSMAIGTVTSTDIKQNFIKTLFEE